MKIAITTTQAPFITGGAEFHARNLKQALLDAGHQVDIVTMPFMDRPIHLLENHIVASRLFDLSSSWAGKVDLCIGLKFPAYCIPHPNKVIWALHQHREAYDLFNTEHSNIKADDEEAMRVRDMVYQADMKYLREAKRIYANSQNVANRMMKYNGIAATPLYHPCPDMEQFTCGASENYILMPSRINLAKRQWLALEAMMHTKSNFKLYLVGAHDNPRIKKEFLDDIEKKGLSDRVVCFDFIPQEQKLELYANARAVLFIPKDEDYGYITLEGMSSSKPIITASDSGGPLEFVEDGVTGSVVEPTPEAIAEALEYYAGNKERAVSMGQCGKEKLATMNISWNQVVEELTR